MNIEATPEAPTEANREDAPAGPATHGAAVTTLSLPLLHRDSVAQDWRNAAPHLWPGLPRMPQQGYVALAGYPFSPEEALACLADLEAMSMAVLSGVPLQALAAQEHRPQSARELEEQDALRRFAATGEDRPEDGSNVRDDTLLRKAAHRALLWAWLLEERQREVRDLTSNFDASASHLVDALGVEEDNDFSELHASSMQLGQDSGLLPSWKLVMHNAALFLPHPCAIVVNDARMAEAVAESCAECQASLEDVDAATLTQLALPTKLGLVWKRAELPLWMAAGLNAASPSCPWLQRTAHILLPLPCARAANTEAA